MDLWLKAHDDFSKVFEKMGVEAEGLRGKIGLLAGGFGVLAGGVLAESVQQAADWQSKTQALGANTNMGAAGLDAMRTASIALSEQTGQDAERVAEGYMHIANHAYEGAAAVNILSAATKNAAATHGDAADDANILAGVLREMNVSTKALAQNSDLATRYMDTLHNAVANSNWTMKDFTEGSKRAIATAGAFGVPLSQVSAQLATLSMHGFPTASVAALNWAGMLRSLEGPTAKGRSTLQPRGRHVGHHARRGAPVRRLEQRSSEVMHVHRRCRPGAIGRLHRHLHPGARYGPGAGAGARWVPAALPAPAGAGHQVPGDRRPRTLLAGSGAAQSPRDAARGRQNGSWGCGD